MLQYIHCYVTKFLEIYFYNTMRVECMHILISKNFNNKFCLACQFYCKTFYDSTN